MNQDIALRKKLVPFLLLPPVLASAADEPRFALRAPQTVIARQVYDLHAIMLGICIAIAVVVFGVMLYSILRHRKAAGYEAKQFSGNKILEIVWTVIPCLIVAGMAYPATKTVIEMKDRAETPAANVDATRMVGADRDSANWMTYGHTYSEQCFSPLARITADNVKQLGLAWYADLDTDRDQEGTPLVIDGVMYVSTAWSLVKAYDARTGTLLWSYDPAVPRRLQSEAVATSSAGAVAARLPLEQPGSHEAFREEARRPGDRRGRRLLPASSLLLSHCGNHRPGRALNR